MTIFKKILTSWLYWEAQPMNTNLEGQLAKSRSFNGTLYAQLFMSDKAFREFGVVIMKGKH